MLKFKPCSFPISSGNTDVPLVWLILIHPGLCSLSSNVNPRIFTINVPLHKLSHHAFQLVPCALVEIRTLRCDVCQSEGRLKYQIIILSTICLVCSIIDL